MRLGIAWQSLIRFCKQLQVGWKNGGSFLSFIGSLFSQNANNGPNNIMSTKKKIPRIIPISSLSEDGQMRKKSMNIKMQVIGRILIRKKMGILFCCFLLLKDIRSALYNPIWQRLKQQKNILFFQMWDPLKAQCYFSIILRIWETRIVTNFSCCCKQ